ncbi:hypothetical protein ACLKA7_016814 [Drosophila subpalustris]
MNVPIVWIMGGQGSGKSTLSQSISDKYGYMLLDPDAMVDREIDANTEKGKEFAEKRNEGQAVPLTDVINLLERELMANKGGLKGFVIDGYPQNQGDALVLEESIGSPDLIIALQVDQDTATTRRSARGSTVTATISFYSRNAAPVLAKYSNKLMQIDGERDAEEIFNDVVPNIDTITKNHGNQITIEH